jgi:bacillithiol system protein YtxJ
MSAMSNVLTELKALEDLDTVIARSATEPVLIYKHSLTCGTSGMALEEVRDLLAGPPINVPVGLVLVQSARAVSNEVATRFGVRHESPQILLVRGGRVVWHASHYRVTAEAIAAALQRHSSSAIS